MWQGITVVMVVAGVILHFWWKRRAADLSRECEAQKSTIDKMRQEQQQSMLRIEAQQRALFNSLLEGLLVLDVNQKVQLVNQALLDLFHLKNDIFGLTIMEAFRINALRDLVSRVTHEGQVRGFELDLPGLNNGSVEINAAALLSPENKPQGMIFIFHDLTRIKQLENTRKEFVANVSHELRTPLTLIKGYVETLIDGAKNDPALTSKFLQTIQKHTDRLTFLIEDLLTISRLESGQIVLNFQEVLLAPIVERVLDDLQSRAAEKHITMENLVPRNTVVTVDTDRFQQVLFNLIDNALKYGYADGVMRVGAKVKNPNFIEVSVQDEGPGIPPEARERVFERFYRVDRARSREAGGTGLGLSIVKHIVQSHGGEVWVESLVGKGATFYFTLPVK